MDAAVEAELIVAVVMVADRLVDRIVELLHAVIDELHALPDRWRPQPFWDAICGGFDRLAGVARPGPRTA